MSVSVAVVIPARLNSTRLPRKLLLDRTGKPLIQHTYEMAVAADIGRVYVATDSLEIEAAVLNFGGEAIMTPALPSGTARVAWATVNRLGSVINKVINLQADEPELEPYYIKRLLFKLESMDSLGVATLAAPIFDSDLMACPGVVKVVINNRNEAMYFSRSAIPWVKPALQNTDADFRFGLRHVGIYGYRREILEQIDAQPGYTPLALAEDLEQLSWLQRGWPVGVAVVDNSHSGIDTAGDYDAFCTRIAGRNKGKAPQDSPARTGTAAPTGVLPAAGVLNGQGAG